MANYSFEILPGYLVLSLNLAVPGLCSWQILLFLAVELAPHYLFKAVGLGVDELGVLWHRLVGVTVGTGGQGKE